MKWTLEYSPAAEADVSAAYDWYEQQRAVLGSLVLEDLARTDALIGEAPQIFRRVRMNARRALLRKFPYSVFYLERNDHLIVAAVFHGSRDPVRWQNQLDV